MAQLIVDENDTPYDQNWRFATAVRVNTLKTYPVKEGDPEYLRKIGIAICHDKDTFNRKEGVRLALLDVDAKRATPGSKALSWLFDKVRLRNQIKNHFDETPRRHHRHINYYKQKGKNSDIS